MALCAKVTQVYSVETIHLLNSRAFKKGYHDLSWYNFIPEDADSSRYWNSVLGQYDYTYHVRDTWRNNFGWLEPRIYQPYEFLIIKATSEQKKTLRARAKQIKTYHGDKSICFQTLNFAYDILEDLGYCYKKEVYVKYSRYPRQKTIWNKEILVEQCKDIITN